jgi:hypothetical protein
MKNMRTTKRNGRTKRAAVAILIALSLFAGRLDPTVETTPGRPRATLAKERN